MNILAIAFIALFILFLWLRIDYKLGRKNILNRSKRKEFPLRKSNFSFFIDGGNLFDDLFNEIRNAREHVHISFYIVKNDEFSSEFLSLLMKKAQEGIQVRLLLDWVGSFRVSRKKIRALRDSGVDFSFSHKPKFPFLFYSLNKRNHRKITVIDGKIGYIGGFNIGKEYLGHDPNLGAWRDYHLKATGEGVNDMQSQFLSDWEDATSVHLHSNQEYFPRLTEGKFVHRFVPTDGAFLKARFIDLIQQAKTQIMIGTPYFIPGKEIRDELIAAANRGINVEIMVPMKSDHPLVKEAAFPYFKPLIQAGCQVRQFYYGFYHAKIIVIDDVICDIGTANFDKRSLYINHEFNCFIYDKPFITLVKKNLRQEMSQAEELTLDFLRNRSIVEKVKTTIATLISHFL